MKKGSRRRLFDYVPDDFTFGTGTLSPKVEYPASVGTADILNTLILLPVVGST